MARATLLLRERVINEHGDIREVVVWQLPLGGGNPSGVRYRLAFVRRGEDRPAVLYDNHPPKGHHRHVEGVESSYRFVEVNRLMEDFMADVRRVSGG